MKNSSVTVAFVVGLLNAVVSANPVMAAGIVGNGSPLTCTEGALDAALAGGGTVTFNCGAKPFTITVTTMKTITADTTLDGGGLLTLSGGGKVQILTVNAGVTLSLSNTTLSRGNNTGGSGGGAITSYNGTVTVNNCTFSHNSSDDFSGGGAIANDYDEHGLVGPLTVTNCTFSYNSARTIGDPWDSSSGGGAIFTHGSLTVNNSTFSHNSSDGFYGGGAIWVYAGLPVTVSDSTFSYNVSRGVDGGGAIAAWVRSDNGLDALTVTNCTFSNNSQIRGGGWDSGGGAIWLFNGPHVVTNSTFSHNRVRPKDGGSVTGGGAIYCDECNLTVTDSTFSYNNTLDGSAGGAIANAWGGSLTVANSAFFRNSVSGGRKGSGALDNGGGAIYSENGPLIVTDSTFYRNMVSDAGKGGAIAQGPHMLAVTNATFSRNRAGRSGEGGAIALLAALDAGWAILQNTIVANSTRGANCAGGIITDGGHNLQWPLTDTSCVGYVGDPKLAGLKNNGGPTQTMALKPGSAAINAGDNAICAAAPVNNLDQRGFVRPGVGVTNCSIGAYEYGAVAP